jgi:Rrf2 family iron-sulfur cluster assembly transcriptional regulator
MILTTKTRYAVMAIIEIASEECGKPLSLNEISERQNISLSYLEQIFARLKKSGIVTSVKGPGGGYVLKNSKVTVTEVIKSMGEPVKMTRCGNKKKGCSLNKARCKTHHIWQGLEDKIYEYLDSVRLN